jgi:predicted nucleotidyltransferase
MDYGPVLSEVLNLVKGQHADEAIWSEFIRKDGYAVALEKDPGILSLSRYEIEMLTDTAERYRDVDDWKIVEETHTFDEWKTNFVHGTSTTIPLEDIIQAVGRTNDLSSIIKEAEETAALRRLVGSLS